MVVRPRKGCQGYCGSCGKNGPTYDTGDPRRFQYLPMWGILVFFVYCMRRINCKTCGVTTELIPWADGKHRLTTSFRWYLAHWAKKMSWSDVAQMWKPYIKVIRANATKAVHVLDRFHIMTHFSKAIDEIRAGEHRSLKDKGLETLKHSRWCLLKWQENLTDKQRNRLADLLAYNLKSIRAYLLKEDFQQFWEYVSPSWAEKFLDIWCRRTMKSRLDSMKKIAKMLRRYKPEILNYFRARKQISQGCVEGLNNKVKSVIKKSYSFSEFKTIEMALYQSLGDLPEPNFTHRFW